VVIGPIKRRRNGPLLAGHELEIHEHNFPHAMQITVGAAVVVVGDEEHLLESYAVNPEGCDHIVVPAGVKHTVRPKIDGTIVDCLFPHRDNFDEVTICYDGNDRAYSTWVNGAPS
jgi:hypothetical protein